MAIKKNDERNFDTSCEYEDTDHPLCLPKVIVFLQLIKQHGADYFDTIRNRDVEKNKLLEAYGYSLSDNLKGKFEFVFKDGKPFLRVLDPKIKRINTTVLTDKPAAVQAKQQQLVEKDDVAVAETPPDRKLGLVFDFNKSAYPFFQVHVVSGELNEAGTGFAGNTAALDITHFIDTSEYNENDINLLNAVRRLQDIEINKYISRNTPFNTSWEEELPDAMPGKEIVQLVNEYMLPRLRRLIADAGTDALAFMLPKGKEFVTANIEQIDIFPEPAVTEFYVDREGADAFSCDCLVRLRGMVHGVEQNESPSPLVFLYNHQLFLFNNSETISLIEKFLPGGKMIIPASEWAATLHEFILPLAKEHKVDFDASMLHVMKNIVPEARLLLIEKGEHLVFKPQFSYKGYETDLLGKEVFLIPEGDKIMAIHRNKEKEQAFVARLKTFIPI